MFSFREFFTFILFGTSKTMKKALEDVENLEAYKTSELQNFFEGQNTSRFMFEDFSNYKRFFSNLPRE